MISLYEQLKRAKKGDVIYTALRAKAATSAAHRVGRKVQTAQFMILPLGNRPGQRMERIWRIKVLK